MKPDFAETQTAASVLLAAQQAGWAPIRYDGQLQEAATYRYFWELLKRARMTGVSIPEAAETLFFGALAG
jgi:citrate lyase subunit beta / citryl-CoA lyase